MFCQLIFSLTILCYKIFSPYHCDAKFLLVCHQVTDFSDVPASSTLMHCHKSFAYGEKEKRYRDLNFIV